MASGTPTMRMMWQPTTNASGVSGVTVSSSAVPATERPKPTMPGTRAPMRSYTFPASALTTAFTMPPGSMIRPASETGSAIAFW